MIEERASRAWSKGLQHASDLLIRRGTAMGPLIPTLFLIPFFLIAIYLFQNNPWIYSPLLLLLIGMVFEYFRQFSRFASTDPDRLQSEEYRYEMKKIEFIAAKELPSPVPLQDLKLAQPGPNPANPMPNLESIDKSNPLHQGN